VHGSGVCDDGGAISKHIEAGRPPRYTAAPRHIRSSSSVDYSYETVDRVPLAELKSRFDWSAVRVYALNAPGENHGILLGAQGWTRSIREVLGCHLPPAFSSLSQPVWPPGSRSLLSEVRHSWRLPTLARQWALFG
jgi:hypothetical protein